MGQVRLIEIKEEILFANRHRADEIRDKLRKEKVFMLNLMASPGAGKTSLIIETIRHLKNDFNIAVIEGDIDSLVDSEKVSAEGIPVVQLRTGGACHLDAPMIHLALKTMDLENLDLIIIENVGNLVCPAEFDTGAVKKAMILSVPEGDDKILKYPLMFSVCDALVVSKTDYLDGPGSDFKIDILQNRASVLSPKMKFFQTSCRTGEGLDEWCQWLRIEMEHYFAVI
jgi:hydrogenase nickel incorporation protein HypB